MSRHRAVERLRIEAGAEPSPLPPVRLGERLVKRRLLRADAIPAVLDLQRRWGCRFGEALIAGGAIHPLDLSEALAESWGLLFVDLIAEPPDAALSKAAHLDIYLSRLFLPWRRIGGVPIVACVDPTAETRRLIADLYGPRARIAVTSKLDIIWTVERLFRDSLAHDATFKLDEQKPHFSARRVTTRPQRLVLYAGTAVLGAAIAVAPDFSAGVVLLLLSLFYMANIALRLVLFGVSLVTSSPFREVAQTELAALDDASLPVYTVIAPLYREAHMVAKLTGALKALDYPGLMAQPPQAKIGIGP